MQAARGWAWPCLYFVCWGEVAQHCDLYLGAVECVAAPCPQASLRAPEGAKADATKQEGKGLVQVGAVRLCPREAAEALCRAWEGWALRWAVPCVRASGAAWHGTGLGVQGSARMTNHTWW